MAVKKSEWQKLITPVSVPVHIHSIPHAKSVACGVLVNAGTRDERQGEEDGLAHALEHMCFQGTKDFPNSFALSSCIEDVGGKANAFTGEEQTFFFNLVPSDEIEKSIAVLFQMMIHPLFP